MAETIPALSFADAEAVGEALHDHWQKMTGSAPIARGDLAWADLVQFVARTARGVAASRRESQS